MTAEFKNQLVKAPLQQQGGGGGGKRERELHQKGGMITIPNQAIKKTNTTAGANGSIWLQMSSSWRHSMTHH